MAEALLGGLVVAALVVCTYLAKRLKNAARKEAMRGMEDDG